MEMKIKFLKLYKIVQNLNRKKKRNEWRKYSFRITIQNKIMLNENN